MAAFKSYRFNAEHLIRRSAPNGECSIEDREAEVCRTSREERRDHYLTLHSLLAIGDSAFRENA